MPDTVAEAAEVPLIRTTPAFPNKVGTPVVGWETYPPNSIAGPPWELLARSPLGSAHGKGVAR
jgi:hypothetical protein